MRDEVYEAALEKVNELREIRKIGGPLLELPRGRRMDGMHCPIQKALGCDAVCSVAIFWHIDDDFTKSVTGECPEEISKFIAAFDAEKYLELIEK